MDYLKIEKTKFTEAQRTIQSNYELLKSYINLNTNNSVLISTINNQIEIINQVFDNIKPINEINKSKKLDFKWWRELDETWKELAIYNISILQIIGTHYKSNWSGHFVSEEFYIEDIYDKISTLSRYIEDEDDNYIKTILEELSKKENIFINPHLGNKIKNLKPIRNFTKITELGLSNVKCSIQPISELINLERLTLMDNNSPLNPVSKLINLKFLRLDKNSDNLTPISKLVNIKELMLIENSANLHSLEKLVNLEKLDLYNNHCDLFFLSNLRKLKSLDLSSNSANLKPLSNLKNLKELILDDNSVDLTPINNLENLEYLNVQSFDSPQNLNPISSLITKIRRNGGTVII